MKNTTKVRGKVMTKEEFDAQVAVNQANGGFYHVKIGDKVLHLLKHQTGSAAVAPMISKLPKTTRVRDLIRVKFERLYPGGHELSLYRNCARISCQVQTRVWPVSKDSGHPWVLVHHEQWQLDYYGGKCLVWPPPLLFYSAVC